MVSRFIRWIFSPNPVNPIQPEAPPPTLRETPWKVIKGWTERDRNELKSQIQRIKPKKVTKFNIVLTGQVTSGKSSFYNSINSTILNIVNPSVTAAGAVGHSLTREFRRYPIKGLPITIGDTMGIQTGTSDVDIENSMHIVDGHVPDRYTFNLGEEFVPDSPGFIKNPTLANRAHCVVIVIDLLSLNAMNPEVVRKIQSLCDGLINRDIPRIVLLTHLDEFDATASKDISKTYNSIELENMVSKVCEMIHGIPENLIFPVVNYQRQVEIDHQIDILLLYALRSMLFAAEGYLKNQRETKCCCFKLH